MRIAKKKKNHFDLHFFSPLHSVNTHTQSNPKVMAKRFGGLNYPKIYVTISFLKRWKNIILLFHIYN